MTTKQQTDSSAGNILPVVGNTPVSNNTSISDTSLIRYFYDENGNLIKEIREN